MNNELYHYGILGQKWGVRRYQNLDGSLTEEGKARRESYINKEIRNNNRYYEKYKKKYKEMADKTHGREKQKWIDRMNGAEESRKRVNTYLKNMSYDQIVANQKADRKAAVRAIGLGTGLAAAVAGSAGIAAIAPSAIASGVSFAKSLDYTSIGSMAKDTIESGIRLYARARGWAIGIALDEGINSALSQMTIDPANAERMGQALGTAAKVAGDAALKEATTVDAGTAGRAVAAYSMYKRYKP